MKITGKMLIEEVLKRHPETSRVFQKRGMGCLTCMGAAAESIQNGSRMHGIDPDQLLQELNRAVAGKKS